MRRPSLPTLAAAVLAAACAPNAPNAPNGSGAPAAATLAVVQRVTHADTAAREPMVVELPDGALFAAGYGGPFPKSDAEYRAQRPLWASRLWTSRDGGASWSRVDVARGVPPDVIGNSDVDLAVARDGTLYFASMTFDAAAGEGRRVAVGASRDGGATWTWRVVARERFDDRPWIAVAPDGTAHLIWNDGGVWHASSRDRGVTWSSPRRVSERGGSSHLAVGPNGELAVRVAPASASGNRLDPGVDFLALSTDGGATWQARGIPSRRHWAPADSDVAIPKWVDPLAWDAAGRLYALWTDTSGVWLARTADRAATWTRWRIAATAACFYPYLVARGEGDLAATWMCGKRDALRWRAAHVALGTGGAPSVALSAPQEFDAWDTDPKRANALYRDPAGEYVGVTFLRDGAIGVVTPVQHPARTGFTWWKLR